MIKKIILVLIICISIISCANKESANSNSTTAHKKEMTFSLIPAKDSDKIVKSLAGLDLILKESYASEGYLIDKVNVKIADSYNAVGEALSSGQSDLALMSAGIFTIFSDDIVAVLGATRAAISIDSENPMDYNDENNPPNNNGKPMQHYRSLIMATPSPYGKILAKKVAEGEKLTWEDINKAKWSVLNNTSSTGYIYPAIWLKENYNKTFKDLKNLKIVNDHSQQIQLAASEESDIIVTFADYRIENEHTWNLATNQIYDSKPGLGREKTIWEELKVIGVSKPIYFVVLAANNDLDKEFIDVSKKVFLKIMDNPKVKEVFGMFNIAGFDETSDERYLEIKKALDSIKED